LLDYKDHVHTDTVRVCSKKPERKCNIDTTGMADECEIVYETVCETVYTSKNVTEDRSECSIVKEQMCTPPDSQNCMDIPTKVTMFSFDKFVSCIVHLFPEMPNHTS
jgi:hypothetical protein